MPVRRMILALILAALCFHLVAGCEKPATEADKVKLMKIFNDVLVQYNSPEFKEKMTAEKNGLRAIKYALQVQEKVANNYGLEYFEYMEEIGKLKKDPEVETKLFLIKDQMREYYKFKLDMDKVNFSLME